MDLLDGPSKRNAISRLIHMTVSTKCPVTFETMEKVMSFRMDLSTKESMWAIQHATYNSTLTDVNIANTLLKLLLLLLRPAINVSFTFYFLLQEIHC